MTIKRKIISLFFWAFPAILLIVTFLPFVSFGGEVPSINGEITALKVLEVMYGKLTVKGGKSVEPAIWRNISVPNDLNRYWKYEDGSVYVAFEGRYKENGADKYILITQTRPFSDGYNNDNCHGCAPLIGGFIFARQGNRWVMESQNKYITVIGKWGWLTRNPYDDDHHPDTVELVNIGPEKHGVLIRFWDMSQGYEVYGIRLIVPYKNMLKVSLADGFEGAGDGACTDKAAKNKQSIDLTFDKKDKGEFYNVKVVKRWNKGACSEGVKSVKETTKYKFADGLYHKTGTVKNR